MPNDPTWTLGGVLEHEHPVGSTPLPDRYVDLGLIAQGGMGEVRRVQDRVLGREVAMKVLRPEIAFSPGSTARFVRETRSTANLQHPGIIPVHDAGTLPDGRPFFTMSIVSHMTFADALIQTPGNRRLLTVLQRVCETMAFAHARGVVHRDLKPDNVLLGEFGEAFVIDWGLVTAGAEGHDERQVDAAGAVQGEGLTRADVISGTPSYMSPEQARGETAACGPPADVWALGVMIFEASTGTRPFRGESTWALLDLVRSESPPPLRSVDAGAAPELEAIVARALAPRVADRYPSARELGDDLRAFLEGRQVAAYNYRPIEALLLAIRPYQAPLAVGAIATVLLLVGGSLALVALDRRAQEAELARHDATASRDDARAQLAGTLAEAAALALEQKNATFAWVYAAFSLQLTESPEARGLLVAARSSPMPLPTWASPDDRRCRKALFSPVGNSVLCTGEGGLTLYGERDERWHVPLHHNTWPNAIAWSADGALAAGGAEEVGVVDVATGRLVARVATPDDRASSALFLPDGSLLTGMLNGANIARWSPTGSPLPPLAAAPRTRSLAISRDGRTLAAGSGDHHLRTWRLSAGTWRPDQLLQAPTWVSLAFSPNGTRLASSGDWEGSDGRFEVHGLDGAPRQAVPAHRGEVFGIDWSSDGTLVATGGNDPSIRLWSAPAMTLAAVLPVPSQTAYNVSFRPDGAELVSGDDDRRARRWRLPQFGDATGGRLAGGIVGGLTWTGDGALAVTGDGALLSWSPLTRGVSFERARAGTGWRGLVRAGPEWVTGDDRGRLLFFDARTGATTRVLEALAGAIRALDISPDGQTLAVGGDAPDIALVDLASGARHDDVPPMPGLLGVSTRALVYGADGRLWVCRAAEEELAVLAADGSAWHTARSAHAASLVTLARSHDYGVILEADEGSLRLLDGTTGRLVLEVEAPGGMSAAIDEAKRRVALVDGRGHAVVYDATTGARLAQWRAHENWSLAATFSPDGRHLLTSGGDRAVRLWNLDFLDVPAESEVDAARRATGFEVRDGRVAAVADWSPPAE